MKVNQECGHEIEPILEQVSFRGFRARQMEQISMLFHFVIPQLTQFVMPTLVGENPTRK
jgi:hypothetical protein